MKEILDGPTPDRIDVATQIFNEVRSAQQSVENSSGFIPKLKAKIKLNRAQWAYNNNEVCMVLNTDAHGRHGTYISVTSPRWVSVDPRFFSEDEERRIMLTIEQSETSTPQESVSRK